MPPAMEVLTGRVVNPGATLTAVTNATGDSLSVRSTAQGTNAWLLNQWALGATAGTVRVRSPRMHDNVQGVRTGYAAADPRPLMDWYSDQPLYALDTLIVEQSGGGAETDCESILVYYDDLPGSNARLVTWDQIKGRQMQKLTVEISLTTGGTAGDYGGSTALNATFDLLIGGVDYAILGYVTPASILTVGIKGPDTGNYRVGGPGHVQRDETRNWFVWLAETSGKATIPIINAANKASTFLDVVDTATATARTIDLIVARLV